MGKRASSKRAPSELRAQKHKEYHGFRTLVLAELEELGPRGLAYKGRCAEVPFYFCLRGRVNGDSVLFVTFALRQTFETVILSVFCDSVRLLRSFFELQHTVLCMK